MKIVFASAEELFEELKDKRVKEARAESVVTRKHVGATGRIRQLSFDFYVTALINSHIATVVIPYHKEFEGLVERNADIIDQKESKIRNQLSLLAKRYSIEIKPGAFWDDLPFTGDISP